MNDDADAAAEMEELVLSAHDIRRLAALKKTLNDFQSVMGRLQRSDLTIAQARRLFDGLIEKYPVLGGHIGPDADIIHSSAFENGLVNLMNGGVLTLEETEAVRSLLLPVSLAISDSLSILFDWLYCSIFNLIGIDSHL